MSEGQSKRVVKKSNKEETMNIKLSTKDKDILSKDKKINIDIEGKSKKHTNKKNTLKGKDVNQDKNNNNIEKRISKLIEENEKYKKELDSIQLSKNEEIEKEISEILSLNQKISILDKEQIKVSNENKIIISKIKAIEEKVSKKFESKCKNSKILEIQRVLFGKKRDIKKEIKIKEKQNLNAEKSIKYNKKEINKLNKLLENNKENDEQIKIDELKKINNKINELNKEIKELNKIKLEHKLCNKKENILKIQLSVLSNEYEFESKKSNMIETEQIEKKEPTKIGNVNMTMEYGEKIRLKTLKNIKNKYNSKIRLINYKSYNYLFKELNENKKLKEKVGSSYKNIHERNLKTMGNADLSDFNKYLKKGINFRIDTKSPKKYLFSEQEKVILKKLLPNEYYNNYNEKFNKVENKLNEIEEQLKGNDKIKKEINLDNIKCGGTMLKLKELSNIKNNLFISYIKNNKKIMELKKKIQSLNDDINKQDLILARKMKNNDLIKKNIDILYESKNFQTEE